MAILLVLSALVPCLCAAQNSPLAGQVPSPHEIDQFFQGKLLSDNPYARYNSRYFRLMGEKPLFDMVGPEATQVYRLLIETHPYGVPVVVRLMIGRNDTGEVVGKIGHSPRFPDHLTANRTAKLSQADTDEFLKLLGGSDFWSMPVLEKIDTHQARLGEPGWMFEGAKEGYYHVVCRGTSSLASLRKVVTFLQDVSKLDLASTANRPDYANIPSDKPKGRP